ncbi:MAG: TIGR02757 family protein [Saprospiraceae bacterium]|nr:TIGR02757 family protein [Saprospiraceae bacterium]
MLTDIRDFMEECVEKYNRPSFIELDPISIPHRFSDNRDKEIIGFWVAILSWGQRKTIINSGNKLAALMDESPYDFIINHTESDRKRFLDFKHRTFNGTDALYFLQFFQEFYKRHNSLEEAFARFMNPDDTDVENGLAGFHRFFFQLPDAPQRTQKHIATPLRKSTCKRINMFLRWMVRTDKKGVDFGIWNNISPAQLLVPLDVHVDRVARNMGLITRKQTDWQTVLELTENLRKLDPTDPVKYDYALFGLGVLDEDNPVKN